MLPQKIWTLWLDGEDQAPPLCRHVFKAWRRFNPDWELRVLDKDDLAAFLPSYPPHVRDLPAQALSDILRCRVLNEEGGVWADASVLPAKALKDWLPGLMQTGFFAFDRPGPDRLISSWFLAAEPSHPIVQQWEEQVRRYWQEARTLHMDPRKGDASLANPTHAVSPEGAAGAQSYPYFWFHYLFGYMCETQGHIRALWEATPKLSAQPPHHLQRLLKATPPATPQQMRETYGDAAVVHKLDWRIDLPPSLVAGIENACA